MRRVYEVMTHEVFTVDAWTPFKDVVTLMRDHDVSALPVLDRAKTLIGIVSEADLMLKQEIAGGPRRIPWRGDMSRPNGMPPWILRSKAAGIVARDLMTSPVVTVTGGAPVALAARLMRENSVKRLPVTDPHGTLVGIVSRSDLLTVFLRSDDEIRAAIDEALNDPRPSIDPGQARVIVEDGVATLHGEVPLKSQIRRLVSIASEIDGVVGVEARLKYDIDDIGPASANPSVRDRPPADLVSGTWRSPQS
jgi:CBS domain-containing protein